MKNLLQSVVLAEIGRIADLSTLQQYQIATWLLDHGVRFATEEHAAPALAHGMTIEVFQAINDLCSQDKRIQAIKLVRQWAGESGFGSTHPLGTLKGAKDFIDEHFPRTTQMPGYS